MIQTYIRNLRISALEKELQMCTSIDRKLALAQELIAALTKPDEQGRRAEYLCARAESLTHPPEDVVEERLIEAEGHYREALGVFQASGRSVDVANTLANLGRLEIIRAQFLAGCALHATPYLDQALESFPRNQAPAEWMALQLMLAQVDAYRAEREGEPARERAIARLEAALAWSAERRAIDEGVGVQINLAMLYERRVAGDRADNIERSLALLRQAANQVASAAPSTEAAGINLNLSIVYGQRLRGPRPANLTQAIQHGLAALHAFEQAALREPVARACLALGHVYLERGRVGDDRRAARLFRRALRHYRPDEHPEAFASIHNSLGVLIMQQATRSPHEERQAASHFVQALAIYQQGQYPYRWATIQHSLGVLAAERAYAGDVAADERAVAHFAAALSELTPDLTPSQYIESAGALGRLHLARGRLAEAHTVFVKAHAAATEQRRGAALYPSRQRLAQQHEEIYGPLAAACIALSKFQEALTWSEAGKSRAFLDILTREGGQSALDDSPEGGVLGRLRTVWGKIDRLTLALVEGPPAASAGQPAADERIGRLRALREQATGLEEQLQFEHPALRVALAAPALDAAGVRELSAGGAPLVTYFHHGASWWAFVIHAGELHCVALPASCEQAIEQASRWVGRAIVDHNRFGRPGKTAEPDDATLSHLHAAFIAPLLPLLPSGGPLTIAPHGRLHHVPLAAAHESPAGPYLVDRYTLSFAPSLSVLHTLLRQALARAPRRLLSVAYPGPEGSEYYLPNVLAEAKAIQAAMGGGKEAHGDDATIGALLAAAPYHTVVHLGCHGAVHPRHPRQSGLLLADGWLSMQRLLQLHPHPGSLYTVAACLGAQSVIQPGDEQVGVVQGLLLAGATTVVAGLWKVDDSSTRELFTHFYLRLATGMPVDAALQAAAQVVRAQPRWANPLYWAAFQAYGAPWRASDGSRLESA